MKASAIDNGRWLWLCLVACAAALALWGLVQIGQSHTASAQSQTFALEWQMVGAGGGKPNG